MPKSGCCIWYDEVKIFEKVEQRLGGNPILISCVSGAAAGADVELGHMSGFVTFEGSTEELAYGDEALVCLTKTKCDWFEPLDEDSDPCGYEPCS